MWMFGSSRDQADETICPTGLPPGPQIAGETACATETNAVLRAVGQTVSSASGTLTNRAARNRAHQQEEGTKGESNVRLAYARGPVRHSFSWDFGGRRPNQPGPEADRTCYFFSSCNSTAKPLLR